MMLRETVLVTIGRPESPRFGRSFTLIELLALLAFATLAILGAVYLHRMTDGPIPQLLGTVIVWFGISMVLTIFGVFVILVKGSGLPYCRNGRCRGVRDYELKAFEEECFWVCKCGDRYELSGRRFMQVTDDGERMPCRIWRRFRGWFAENENEGR